jgi:hypothetical protein
MPTILLTDGFRFFFYSSEGNEPQHIHVTKGDANGKIWLEPEEKAAYLLNFTKAEEKKITEIVEMNIEYFKSKWNEHFSK